MVNLIGVPYSSIDNLILPFTLILWIAFLSSALIVTLVIFLSHKLPRNLREHFVEENESFNYGMMIIIIIGDGTSNFPTRNSFRILIMSFVIVCIVLRAAYTSQMFNFLQSGACHKIVENLMEMEAKRFVINLPYYFGSYVDLKELKYDQKFVANSTVNYFYNL